MPFVAGCRRLDWSRTKNREIEKGVEQQKSAHNRLSEQCLGAPMSKMLRCVVVHGAG